ncbi:MAG: type III pantothenate kinase [Chitinophagales bacterium]
MNLCLDLGNTRHKFSVFDKDKLVHTEVLDHFGAESFDVLKHSFPIGSVILSSVDKPDPELETALKHHEKVIFFSHTTPIPIRNAYSTPETLGLDRLASAVGANARFPGQNILVIDAGTCIKYEIVTADGTYIGGAIAPGLRMRLEAMHNFTARLPLFSPGSLEPGEELLYAGNSTRSAMLSGALLGALLEAEGRVDAAASDDAHVTVLLCGGDAAFFELHMKRQIFAAPNLVAEGLNTILNYNLNRI